MTLTIVKTGAAAVPVVVLLSSAEKTATGTDTIYMTAVYISNYCIEPFFSFSFCPADVDYAALEEVSVAFLPSISTQRITLTTFTDSVAEGDEIFSVIITTTQTAVDITTPQANVTIVDSFGMLCILVFHFTIVQAVGTLPYMAVALAQKHCV